MIAVAGAVGAGKSTLIAALGRVLADTTSIQFDHYERMTRQPIEEVRRWMDEGADIDRLPVPGLGEALAALNPGTGRRSISAPSSIHRRTSSIGCLVMRS